MPKIIFASIFFYLGTIKEINFLTVYFNISVLILSYVIIILSILFINNFRKNIFIFLAFKIITIFAIGISFFLLGHLNNCLKQQPKLELKAIKSYVIVIKKKLFYNKNLFIYLGNLAKYKKNNLWKDTDIDIKIFSRDKINVNDILLIKGQPKLIKPPKNNKFSNICNLQDNIGSQIKLKNVNFYTKIYSKKLSFFEKSKIYVRKKIVNIFKSKIHNKNVFGIVISMLIGNKNYLSKKLKNLYINTGVYHVLAISGLHLGIIIYIFSFFLIYIFRLNKRFHDIILILISFTFAYFIGFTPSISRAFLMFFLFVINVRLKKSYDLLCNLFITAFIIGLVDPNLIKSIGFSFSFLSVLGILIFYKILKSLLNINNMFLRYLWSLTCISLATQILVSPTSIYYFGTFPFLFIISNWIMVPASFIIISLSLGILLLYFIPFIPNILSYFLTHLVVTINTILTYLIEIPNSNLQNINIEKIEVILYYMILLTSFFIFRFRKIFLIPILFLFSIFFCYEKCKSIKADSSQNLQQKN